MSQCRILQRLCWLLLLSSFTTVESWRYLWRRQPRPRVTCRKVNGDWSQWTSWSPACPSCTAKVWKRSPDGDESELRDRRSFYYNSYYGSRYSSQNIATFTKRFRSCLGARCGGRCFGKSSEEKLCPTPVAIGAWSNWTSSVCSATCGAGLIKKTRYCKGSWCNGKQPICQGRNKGYVRCWRAPCPAIGQWSEWSQFSHCSGTCGLGVRVSYRNCSIPRTCRGPHRRAVYCYRGCCPVNGKWSRWSRWTDCNNTCDGYRLRYRNCLLPYHSCGGSCNGDSFESESCGERCCASSNWTDWGGWSQCSVSCGLGTQNRTRECSCGVCDGASVDTQSCDMGCCLVNGTFSTWSQWSDCSVSCGGGNMTRYRRCVGASCGGTCTGPDQQTIACNVNCCPTNGTWSGWTAWSECSVLCGNGMQNRSRECTGHSCGGLCEGPRYETQSCSPGCCPVNGTWSGWSDWSDCSVTCGAGVQSRNRNCSEFACGGYCDGEDLETQHCITDCCPVNGTWTDWSDWSQCTVPCGGGSQNRSRVCSGHSCSGYCDGRNFEARTCNDDCCPVNGTWSDWSDWSQCPVTCGAGLQSRYRNCTEFTCGGYCDGPDSETQPCNSHCCPLNGTWTDWTDWIDCSVTCGGGTQNRSRTCRGHQCGGFCEGMDLETRSCNDDCCPVNGTWSDWSDWSLCTATCGGGVQARHRNCTGSECGGYCDGVDLETRFCNTGCCPLNGSWTDWSDWTECTVACGGGTQNRTRDCSGFACGGFCDGADIEERQCNAGCCPQDGVWTDWTEWSACTTSGETYTHNRTRSCMNVLCGGQFCQGISVEYETCDPPHCLKFQQALVYANQHSIYALPLVCLKTNKTLSPLLIYTNSSITIKSIAYDPPTQFYYYTNQLTGEVLRVKETTQPELFYAHGSEISSIAIDVMDRSLYVVTVDSVILAIDVDASSLPRVISEDAAGASVAAFSQLHGQLTIAFAGSIVMVTRMTLREPLRVTDYDITQPVDLAVDEYNNQLLVAGSIEDAAIVKRIGYSDGAASTLNFRTTINISLNLVGVDGSSYFAPVARGVVAVAKETLEQDRVINTGIASLTDMVSSYYAPEGQMGCGDCPTIDQLKDLICDDKHNYAFEGRLLDQVLDITTGAIRYTFSVSHIHKDENAGTSVGVSIEGLMATNNTVNIYSPKQPCCEQLTAGEDYLLIGQAGVNRLHLRVDDAAFHMNDLTTDQIEGTTSQCGGIVIGIQTQSLNSLTSENSPDVQGTSPPSEDDLVDQQDRHLDLPG